MNFACFVHVNNSSKQQHFNLNNGKLVYCFLGEPIFWTKLTEIQFLNPCSKVLKFGLTHIIWTCKMTQKSYAKMPRIVWCTIDS